MAESALFKGLYFALYSAFGVLSPYLGVFFASRQFSKELIGIFQCIPNVACMVVGPAVSARADASNAHLETMMASILMGAVTTLCMLYAGTSTVLMTILVLLGAIVRAPLTSIFDSTVISSLPDPSTFGQYRLYGAASFGILSLAGGLLLGASSSVTAPVSSSERGFDYIIYANVLACFVSAVLVAKLRSDRRRASATKNLVPYDKLPSTTTHDEGVESVMAVVGLPPAAQPSLPLADQASSEKSSVLVLVLDEFQKNWISVGCFSFVVFVSGISDGIIDAFLFVRLSELGGSGVLMGTGRFITCAAEVVVFQYAGRLYNHWGVWRCLLVTSCAFVLRFSCYMLLSRHWLWFVLPVESLNGLTFALCWQTSCMFAQQIAPPGCEATMQSLLESLHWGLGSGVGALMAGFVYHQFGAEVLFGLAALLSAAALLVAGLGAAFLGLPPPAPAPAPASASASSPAPAPAPASAPATALASDSTTSPIFTIALHADDADDDMALSAEMVRL